MEWYKTLDINMKIEAKTCFELLTGTKFEDLAFLFSLSERMDILYEKLKIEGFEV